MTQKIKHRGSESTKFNSFNNFHISFNRLSIVGIKNGEQPFESKNKKINVWVNGEIYNYKELKKNTTLKLTVIVSLY